MLLIICYTDINNIRDHINKNKEGNKMLTAKEMELKCKEVLEQYEDDYVLIGIRFEDKEREIGEICENSRHNYDREDEREFPEYGTEEYEELEEFDGTSAWNLPTYDDYADQSKFFTNHCYIVAGDNQTNKDDDLDFNEIVIEDAKVIAKIF